MIKVFIFFLTFAFAQASKQEREVEFQWEAFDQAMAYQIYVASDLHFNNIVHRSVVREPFATANLSHGQYYYKVRAVDKDRKPGVWSEPGVVVVRPYSPKPLKPDEESFRIFKKDLEITFEWQAVEGNPEYEIQILKENGEPFLKEKTSDTKIRIPINEEGLFTWRVRSNFDPHISEYSRELNFRLLKSDMGEPLLVRPHDKGVKPAYRRVDFDWVYFPPSNFSHLEIEGPTSLKKVLEKKDSYKLEGLAPGTYKWRVSSSESETSPQKQSEWRSFVTSEEMVSNQDHIIGMTSNYRSQSLSYYSQRSGVTDANITTKDSHFVNRFYMNYQLTDLSSFYLDTSFASVDTFTKFSENTFRLAYNFRFGSKDFQQAFILGLRNKSYLEAWQVGTDLNTQSLQAKSLWLGVKMMGRIPRGYRLHIDISYFSPTSANRGSLNGDEVELQLGISRKLKDKIWWHAYTSYHREVFKYEPENEGKTSWKKRSISPIGIGLEYRY